MSSAPVMPADWNASLRYHGIQADALVARELRDMGTDYWHLRMLVTRLLSSTHIKFIDPTDNNVCCCRGQAQMLDVRKFELRAGWTGNNWLIMLPAWHQRPSESD